MDAPPLVSPSVLASLPSEIVALIQWQAAQIERLSARVAELERQLGKNSSNSSKPPSSEHPHSKPIRPPSKGKRKPGAQPGHPKHERALIPADQCQEVVACVPTACRRCGRGLAGFDAEPLRHQVWEIPEIQPAVTEYQRHRLVCSCGCSTCGALPEGVPAGQAGPQLIAFAGLLMACFRQSKRRSALFMSLILKQPASAGWLVTLQNRAADAVKPVYDELAAALPQQGRLSIDESPSKQGRDKSWIWTFVAASFTVFACRLSRAADVPKTLLGEAFSGSINCDRARMYWAFDKLQYCWAHLKRDFQGLIDSPCSIRRRLGHDLMRPTKEMFALWAKVRDGTLPHADFKTQMQPIRQRIERTLLRGYFDGLVKGFCTDLYENRERLWTFVEMEGIEPTNNAAEQALRHAVIWRKLSFGTQSKSGSEFVERMLTVIETCRRRKTDVYAWLTETVKARLSNRPGPSLLHAEA